MSRVEVMTTIQVSAARALRLLRTPSSFADWMAPDVAMVPVSVSTPLAPGDRFRVEAAMLGAGLDYLVEAVSDREVVFAFSGAWSGRERWSFIADGTETIVRRVYEVSDDSAPLALLAWRTAGRPVVAAHFRIELARFRELAEREPGPRAEIEPPAERTPRADTFPVDEG